MSVITVAVVSVQHLSRDSAAIREDTHGGYCTIVRWPPAGTSTWPLTDIVRKRAVRMSWLGRDR